MGRSSHVQGAAGASCSTGRRTAPRWTATGEPYDDLLVIVTPSAVEKQELVEDERLPFFTIDHFNSHNAVLVQQSRLGEMDRDRLAEIITDVGGEGTSNAREEVPPEWLTRSQPGRARHRGPRPPGRPRTPRGWRRWTC